MIERGNLLFALKRGAVHSQEIETRSFREEVVRHCRTEKPVVCPQKRSGPFSGNRNTFFS